MAFGKKITIIGQSCVIAAFSVFAALAAAASSPVIVASDDFQSYNVGNLKGGNGGTGWAGAWAANNLVVQVVDPEINLQENRAIAFTGDSYSAAKRTLSTALTGGVFVDFLFQFSGAIDDNDFLGLWFGDTQGTNGLNSIGPNIGVKGNCGDIVCDAGSDFFVRAFGFDNSSFFEASNLVENTTYKMFGHLYKSDPLGDYNRFDAWLNPTASEMLNLTNPDVVFSSNISSDYSISSIDTIGFRSLNLDSGDSMKIDNLNIRAVPVLVALVPEPGSIALLGLALAGLGLSRRRKIS